MHKYKRVEITWVDSQETKGWSNIESKVKESKRMNLKCVSIGYLALKNKNRVVLWQSLAFDGEDNIVYSATGQIIIPRCAIKKIRVLHA